MNAAHKKGSRSRPHKNYKRIHEGQYGKALLQTFTWELQLRISFGKNS